MKVSDSLRRAASRNVSAVAGLRRERAGAMELLRSWNCRNCGRANKTAVEIDGSVKCEYCSNTMRIQPSRARGGETAGQLSRAARTSRVKEPPPARS
jgi:DNA-directed RNA polymerase subunit RPC12/RpoP